jgi:hypothetical protein
MALARRFKLNLRLTSYSVLIACLACAAAISGAFAQDYSSSGGYVKDAEILAVQDKAEELFEREDYKRAHFIYRNELAPIGDKYAQYMVGFMTLSGLGVREDSVLASAWYRLAAERRTAPFIAVRDDLNRRLDAVDMERSDELYLRLRAEFSDIVVRMREVREDYELLNDGPTGSRTSRTSSPVIVVKPREGSSMSLEAYRGEVTRRMQKHLNFIVKTLEIERVDADNITSSEISALEAQVMTYVSRVDDR